MSERGNGRQALAKRSRHGLSITGTPAASAAKRHSRPKLRRPPEMRRSPWGSRPGWSSPQAGRQRSSAPESFGTAAGKAADLERAYFVLQYPAAPRPAYRPADRRREVGGVHRADVGQLRAETEGVRAGRALMVGKVRVTLSSILSHAQAHGMVLGRNIVRELGRQKKRGKAMQKTNSRPELIYLCARRSRGHRGARQGSLAAVADHGSVHRIFGLPSFVVFAGATCTSASASFTSASVPTVITRSASRSPKPVSATFPSASLS